MTEPAASSASPQPIHIDESRRRIRDALLSAKRVAVGTHAGEEVRVRMMHPGAWLPDDEAARPIVYLASMKSDPKIREMTTRPEIALLLHESPTGEEHTSWKMEVTGRAEVVKDPAERERAKQATMRTPSILDFGGDVARTSDSVLLRRRLGVWKEIVRWPTLTVSAASVAVGVAAAFEVTGGVRWGRGWGWGWGWGWSARAARTR